MKVKLNIKPDEPTINGHIYPKITIEKEVLSRELPVYLGLGVGELNDLEDLIGFATSKLNENNEIVSDIKLMSSNAAKIFGTMASTEYDYIIKGIGELSEDKKIVLDFKCSSINVIDKER